jgi:queuine tRNA-ribosyltransferase
LTCLKTIKIAANSSKKKSFIKTLHGDVETPSFVPVGTQATVKAVSPRDLREMGAQIVLANTYHLHLRPGENIIKKMGGLAKFMSWNKPTMTDSGGFQVFSLGVGKEGGGVKFLKDEPKTRDPEEAHPRLNKISEEGVTFQSHIDGSTHVLSPETSIEIQEKIGADLIVAFDDLESPKYSREKTKSSLELDQQVVNPLKKGS